MEEKLCPYYKTPCIKNSCLAFRNIFNFIHKYLYPKDIIEAFVFGGVSTGFMLGAFVIIEITKIPFIIFMIHSMFYSIMFSYYLMKWYNKEI